MLNYNLLYVCLFTYAERQTNIQKVLPVCVCHHKQNLVQFVTFMFRFLITFKFNFNFFFLAFSCVHSINITMSHLNLTVLFTIFSVGNKSVIKRLSYVIKAAVSTNHICTYTNVFHSGTNTVW